MLKLVFLRLLELFRQPSFVVATIVFPSMFFWFFALPNAKTAQLAQSMMGSFSAFAILSVVVFQMSVYIATERASSWSFFLRTLSRPAWHSFLIFLGAGFFFALLAVLLVVVTAIFGCELNMPKDRWLPFFTVVFIGGFPFAGLGLLLGVLCSEKTAVPIANLVYLPLSFAGGLWIPPQGLPKVVQDISHLLPTRMYAELVWTSIGVQDLKWSNVWGLCLYSLSFFCLALWLHHRDEGQRYQ